MQIALPTIADSLHVALSEVLWVVNAYVLVYAVRLITSGHPRHRLWHRDAARPGFSYVILVLAALSCLAVTRTRPAAGQTGTSEEAASSEPMPGSPAGGE